VPPVPPEPLPEEEEEDAAGVEVEVDAAGVAGLLDVDEAALDELPDDELLESLFFELP
jgi:hypothetical protein